MNVKVQNQWFDKLTMILFFSIFELSSWACRRIGFGFEIWTLAFGIIDFHVNNGTKIAITLDPLTFILSPVVGGEDKGEGEAQ
jgi:hypothetical protein